MVGQYVNPEDQYSDVWTVPQSNANQSFGNAGYAASLADPWSKYRDNFASMANEWGQDPSKIGALPGVQYQYDQGMDAASRRMQARGATGGGRLAELMKQGQGLAQSTSMPWLQMAGKFGGVDTSSPTSAAPAYTQMLTRGQEQRSMAAGNKYGAQQLGGPVGGGGGGGSNVSGQFWNQGLDQWAQDQKDQWRAGQAPMTSSYSGGGYGQQDPRTMTLAQLNAELYPSSSGGGYGNSFTDLNSNQGGGDGWNEWDTYMTNNEWL